MHARAPEPIVLQALRAPANLYDWDMGWILGERFLLLTRLGRRSGRRYRTMLEVIGRDEATGAFMVMAGLGRSTQWYRNLVGWHYDGSEQARRRLVAELPVIVLRPVNGPSGSTDSDVASRGAAIYGTGEEENALIREGDTLPPWPETAYPAESSGRLA